MSRGLPSKTVEQCRAEIAYYQRILATTTSRDRIRRALTGIRLRERMIADRLTHDARRKADAT
jgi:hypothetical protein